MIANQESKILVVDDEELVQSLILQQFKKIKDWKFYFASNGVEALKILDQEQDIGVVLIDIKMPKMDGLTFLKELMKQDREFRPIIVTAYGDMSNIRKAMNEGAIDFLTKPIDLDDLENTIRRNLEKFELQKNLEKTHHELLEFSKEIELAQSIKNFLFPVDFSSFGSGASVEIYGETLPISNIGGDFFDCFKLDDTHVGFFIGEVADRGVPAALFMTMTRTLLRTFALKKIAPSECFENINKILLVKEIAFAIFVTAFYGVLNIKTGEVNYCNAGHWPALIVQKKGGLREIGRYEGIPLAVTEDPSSLRVKFEEKQFQIEPEDCLIFYTNGVIETQNPEREMFGEDGVKETLIKCAGMGAKDVVNRFVKRLNEFAQGVPQVNELTLFAIRYNGAPK